MGKNFINDYIHINPHSRSGNTLQKVMKVVLHWTGNKGATDENHQKYFDNLDDRYASAHIFVDKDSATCIIPLNEVAFHCNDVQKHNKDGSVYRPLEKVLGYNGNLRTVSIEMCVEKDGTIHPDTIKRSIKVSAELCQMFKLKSSDIVRHYDVTGKNCPAPFVDDVKKFESFKKEVDKILNPPKKAVKIPTSILKEGSKGSDVKILQEKLGIKVDGIFGKVTEEKLKEYQKKRGLKVDGVVGINTWKDLFR